jgi:parvulin-like peptidyl-prolyl isomerase
VARFFCFILVLVVIALASALWVQAGGNNPLVDLLAYAEARAQAIEARGGEQSEVRGQRSEIGGQSSDLSIEISPPDVIAPGNPQPSAPIGYPDPASALASPAPPSGQWPPGYHPPGVVGPPFEPPARGQIPDLKSQISNPEVASPAGHQPPAPIAYPDTSAQMPAPGPPASQLAVPTPDPQQSAIPNPQSAIPQPSTLNPQPSTPQPFERTKVIARVGSEVILLGDVAPSVETMVGDAFKAGRLSEQQLPAAREYATRLQVKELVARKLIYLDAKRTIPAANFPKIEEQMAEAWDKDVLRTMVRRFGVDNPAQLDGKLREAGSTLEREKRNFVEQTLANQWLRTKIDEEKEISHEAMLEYYQRHIADYQVFARARWEHLMVRVDKSPTEAEAYARIAQMGNRLWSGIPWAEVARHESDGPTAAQGGFREWTTQGSLVSTAIDRALFELPLGALSPILKDEQGFHIVRVVERTEAGYTPFSELQASIREKIRSERLDQQRADFVEKLKRGVTIWTIFDGAAAADMVSLEPKPGRRQ